MPKRIALVLLDDNSSAGDDIAAFLRAQPEFQVLVTSAEIGEALRAVRDSTPDVVLLSLSSHGPTGLTLVGALRREAPRSRVIILGMESRHEDVASFVRAGVSGFIMAGAPLDRVLGAIRSVARETSVLPSELTHSLFVQLASRRWAPRTKPPPAEIGPLEVAVCRIPAA